jgi:hypothetical protein
MNGNIDFILYLKVCMPFSLCNIELFQLYHGRHSGVVDWRKI